jgi:CubicO group peptidase (beta-lactamase class C family)
VLALQDDGRLGVQDPVARFLPGVPADKQALTIHHLLTHTAGFAHDVGEPETMPTRAEAVAQILQSPLLFAPGSAQAYSNAGYTLLAAIVEVASGEDFESYQRRRLWLPLGMRHTGVVLPDWSDAQLASGQTFRGAQPARAPQKMDAGGPSWLMRGSGYVSSTMGDLSTWCEALRTGRVLSREARTQLFHPHAREPLEEASYYGYGWQITGTPDGACLITHNGSAGIHYDVVAILPEQEAVLVTFCTQQASPWRDFPERVLGVFTGREDLGFPPVGVADEPVAAFAGLYRLDSGGTLPFRVRGGRLEVDGTSADVQRLFCPWPAAEAADVAALGDRRALVSGVIDGLARGDDEPLAALLPADVTLADERAFWGEYWPRWVARSGAYAGTDVIETVRVDGELRTLALIRFARGATVVGFVHSEGGRAFVDTMERRFLRDIVLAPQGGREFLSFHPQTRRTTRVSFDGLPEARTVTIRRGAETVSGMRLPGR